MKHNITGKHMRARNALLGKQQPLETRLPKASVKENETVHGQFVKAGQPANHYFNRTQRSCSWSRARYLFTFLSILNLT